VAQIDALCDGTPSPGREVGWSRAPLESKNDALLSLPHPGTGASMRLVSGTGGTSILIIGAGSVWRGKYRPALERLETAAREQGREIRVLVAERRSSDHDPLVSDWFCIEDDGDRRRLDDVVGSVNVAVIATWDANHIENLRMLDGRVPVVLIEKPLSDSLTEARSALVDLDRWGDRVRCFAVDHYLSKPAIRYVLRLARSGKLQEMVGQISEIRISIREERGIEPGREILLDHGILEDMLIHALQMLIELLDGHVAGELAISGVQTASYDGSPIRGETSARVEMRSASGIAVAALVGKGQLDEKLVEISGNLAVLRANITTGRVDLLSGDGTAELQGEVEDDAYDVILGEAIDVAAQLR